MDLDVKNSNNDGYDGPVKVIFGRKSEYVSEDVVDCFKKVFPKFDSKDDLVWIEGAGHWVHADRPNEFVTEIVSFLKKIDSTKSV